MDCLASSHLGLVAPPRRANLCSPVLICLVPNTKLDQRSLAHYIANPPAKHAAAPASAPITPCRRSSHVAVSGGTASPRVTAAAAAMPACRNAAAAAVDRGGCGTGPLPARPAAGPRTAQHQRRRRQCPPKAVCSRAAASAVPAAAPRALTSLPSTDAPGPNQAGRA